ncbi:MAG: peptidylprolyl isomerase [Candidatus Vogelbacteria bacterium CG10_big_fil_rev_8_21_14_0_10_51_16]|uniref:Peptidyl-prolyl cis-trans isomerase n=1 Tax=Candidatus Vogelbacteria bacterium CG10_big_fil_rev_8_21_14_0_10_51_16 TaxID=1975045 RepID=A0A2H0RF95_9BACT|nr:MAG: peptidylprolyl isomerase [Candidatus Vogelbacteria bacterium CG10_big_fil_rev_8_21_14_0_10_51_16]
MKSIAILVALVIVGLLGYALITGRDSSENRPSQSATGGLAVEDVLVGDGTEAGLGDVVSVHYTGTLAGGQKFDSSYDRGEPISFALGSGTVIEGWELGLVGMREGGKRRLVIPPELAYGEFSPPGSMIPAQATLFFEVELLDVVGR